MVFMFTLVPSDVDSGRVWNQSGSWLRRGAVTGAAGCGAVRLLRRGAVAAACGACETMRPVAALLGSQAGGIPEASQRHPRGIPEAYQRHTRGKPRGKPQRQTLLHEKIYMFWPERMQR